MLKLLDDAENPEHAFYRQAMQADREGQPFRDSLAEFARGRLLFYKDMGIEKVSISSAGPDNACSACLAQEGKIFSIDEALRLMPLPCPECTFSLFSEQQGFCRCQWLTVRKERST